jgi:hypothetical protein
MNDTQRVTLSMGVAALTVLLGGIALVPLGILAGIVVVKAVDARGRVSNTQAEQDEEQTEPEWKPLDPRRGRVSRPDYIPYINLGGRGTPLLPRGQQEAELPEFTWHMPESSRADLGARYHLTSTIHEAVDTHLNDEDENQDEMWSERKTDEPSMRNDAYFERQRQRRR